MLIASIYANLEDEGVDVLRPVLAEQVSGRVFIIDPRAKVPTDEQWAFRPGQRVYCEWRQFSDGEGFAAIRLAD
jgi:hypothetical protein